MRSKDYNMDVDALIKAVEAQNNLHQYKPHDKAVSKWCEEHEVQEVERLKLPDDFYKLKREEQDTEIVKAIKTMYPDRIVEHVYHFPFQWFYLITDKGYYFTLKSKSRPRTEKEERKIARLREIVKSIEDSKFYQEALSAYKSVKSLKEILPKGSSDLFNMLFTEKHLAVLNSWKESKTEAIDAVEEIESMCHKQKYYSLAPHQLSRQVSIYINSRMAHTLESLGYKVHETTRSEIRREWNKEYLNWDYEEVQVKHRFIKVSNTVFESACKSGRLLPKGKYLDDDGNEVEMKRGRSRGCTNEHRCKKIALFDPQNNEVLQFSSMVDAARHFNVDKSNLSRKMKGLNIGDAVTINKKNYIISNTNS